MIQDIIRGINNHNIQIQLEGEDLILNFDNEINPELLDLIRLHKQDIILYIKNNDMGNSTIPCSGVQESYALSSMQKSIWLHSNFEGASSAYNIPLLEMIPKPDMDVLSESVNQLVSRHETLRTVFKLNAFNEIRQYILPFADITYPVEILDVENDNACYQYVSEDNSEVFNLEKGPLFRIQIIRTSEENYFFYLNIHHIICDAWSVEVLKDELFSIYKSKLSNTMLQLEPLTIQYKDYAEWQSKNTEKSYVDYKGKWNETFKNISDIDLPSSKKRPAYKTYNSKTLQTWISPELRTSLYALCTQNHSSLFIGLISVFRCLVYKYTGINDIILGTPYINREHHHLQSQIGCFINVLPFSNAIDPLLNFHEIIVKERDQFYDLLTMKDFPSDEWLRENAIKRNPSRNTLFDILVSFNNINEKNSKVFKGGDKITELNSWPSKFDITINFQDVNGGLSMNISYNTDVYDYQNVVRMIQHYKKLLGELTINPDNTLAVISIVDGKEEDLLTKEFNKTNLAHDQNKTLIDLFKEQVAKTGNKEAIVFGDLALTFEEVDALSDKLAFFLESSVKDFQIEDIVAINVDKNYWTIISMLAVLKLGGAYVPVDNDYPEERIQFIIEDAECKFVIDENTIEEFQSFVADDKELQYKGNARHLAYILYTSGSTGKPKGVQVEHIGVVNHIYWCTRDFNLTPQDNSLLITSFAYDGSATIIWGCLLSGATLYIVNKEDSKNIDKIVENFESKNITFLKLVPSLFSLLIHSSYFNTTYFLQTVRFIILGGEPIRPEDLKKSMEKYPDLKFANHYGPTEGSIGATVYHIDKNNLKSFLEKPVIGRPFDNVRIYILDDYFNIVPMHVAGTIYIAGIGVARGYKNEKLNEDKFFSDICGEPRMYKTGDYGYWNFEGNIVFQGRRDNQVKVRGYRIELEEIESALNAIPCVNSSSVLIENNNICAYFVSDNTVFYEEIYQNLRGLLPVYMIPNHIYQVDEIPVTLNGKVDKNKLKMITGTAVRRSEIQHPATETELKLSKICEAVFELQDIGVNEDFYTIGCNSLKALQLTNRIYDELQVKVKIEIIFMNPNIKDLAFYIDENNFETDENLHLTDKTIIEI